MTTSSTVRPADSQPAGDRREEPTGPRRWPIYLAVSLLLVALTAAGWAVYFSPVLALKSVAVTGASGEIATEVRTAAALTDGTPLIRLDTTAAAARVRAVPEIASATVVRQWPNEVVITVTTRSPVAVTSANGALWLMDSDGNAYSRVTAVPAGLVQIELAAPGPHDPATAAAISVVGSMTSEFRATVASVRAPSPYNISVSLRDGRTVIWGGADDGAEKMQILPAVLAQPGTIFDISVPALVTTR